MRIHLVTLVPIICLCVAQQSLGQQTVKVRIYNDTGVEVRIKSIGFRGISRSGDHAYYYDDYSKNENKKINGFLKGHRVFVAWDDVTEEIIAVHRVNVNANMRIRIVPNWQDDTLRHVPEREITERVDDP